MGTPSSGGGGADGFVYVPPGSRQFSGPSMLVSEYSAGMVAAYELDSDGRIDVGLDGYGYRWLRLRRPDDQPII